MAPVFFQALFLVLAMAVPGLVHVLWLRSKLARRLAYPVDGGLMVRNRRLFGANKTLGGFLALPPAASLSFWLLSVLWAQLPAPLPDMLWPLSGWQYAGLGLICGFAFLIAELPNSFLKRQIGIAPGAAPSSGPLKVITTIVDRFDSVIGCLVAASLLLPLSVATWVWVLVLGAAQHALFSFLMFRMGLKGRAL